MSGYDTNEEISVCSHVEGMHTSATARTSYWSDSDFYTTDIVIETTMFIHYIAKRIRRHPKGIEFTCFNHLHGHSCKKKVIIEAAD